jgi:hypothetical protein
MFKDGRRNVHDEERNGWPSVVSNDLFQSVEQKICERRRFTISELSCEFPQISLTVLYEIITVKLGYHKFRAKMVSENDHGYTQNALGFDFYFFREISHIKR